MTAVRLLLPQGGLRRWHCTLAERLAAERCRVLIETHERRGAPPPSTALVEALEGLIARPRPPATLDRAPAGAWSAPGVGDADLVFDLTGSAEPEPGAIVPLYDGVAGDAARDAVLLDGRAPWIELAQRTGDAPRVYAAALPAVRRHDLLSRGRAAAADALVELVVQLAARGLGEASARRDAVAARPPAPVRFAAATLAGLVERRLRRLVVHDDHWRVGVRRRTPGEAPFADLDRLDNGRWRWLPDDRRRYFADPFVFEEGGVAYVFCEEYSYATGKGVISVFALDDEGAPGLPCVVLERPYHLSYPFVFRHDGAIWMMPEGGQNRTLELYRADPFPLRWTLNRVLLSGAEIADATPFAWNGDWWLSATGGETEGASWDRLSFYRGSSPIGPWTPAFDGPALIDASAGRPAGRVFEHEGALWRPAQDCRAGYGSGLAFCRIDALAPGEFRQTPMQRFTPPGGLHTFNMTDRFVVIDAAGPRARASWLKGFDG
ncbi:MAG: hypothetical protein ABSF67_22330 [Roseiarcus sp.]